MGGSYFWWNKILVKKVQRARWYIDASLHLTITVLKISWSELAQDRVKATETTDIFLWFLRSATRIFFDKSFVKNYGNLRKPRLQRSRSFFQRTFPCKCIFYTRIFWKSLAYSRSKQNLKVKDFYYSLYSLLTWIIFCNESATPFSANQASTTLKISSLNGNLRPFKLLSVGEKHDSWKKPDVLVNKDVRSAGLQYAIFVQWHCFAKLKHLWTTFHVVPSYWFYPYLDNQS